MKYIGTIKSKKSEQGENMLYIGENKHTRSNLVGKTEGKRKLARPQGE
jgi:hypothetical protein